MTGETPGVEHSDFDKNMAFEAMSDELLNGEIRACLSHAGQVEFAETLEAIYEETGQTAGDILLLVELNEEDSYLYRYEYELLGADLTLTASTDFEDVKGMPVVCIDSNGICWETAHAMLIKQTLVPGDDGLPVYN